jgi:DNA-binding NarL/FixJ family response regulator
MMTPIKIEPRIRPLTRRQQHVKTLLAYGLTPREISQQTHNALCYVMDDVHEVQRQAAISKGGAENEK